MRDVLERMQILAAWLKPGGATPDEPIPDKYSTLVEAIAQLESLRSQVEGLRTALGRIERGGTSVLFDAALNDDPINPDVLQEIVKDASSALSSTVLKEGGAT